MNILSINFYNYFVTKRSLNNTPYRKISLTADNIPKQERNMFKLYAFLIRLLPYHYTARIWLTLIISKAFRSSRSQMFYKIVVPKQEMNMFKQHSKQHSKTRKEHVCSLVFYKTFYGVKLLFFLKVQRSYFRRISRFLQISV